MVGALDDTPLSVLRVFINAQFYFYCDVIAHLTAFSFYGSHYVDAPWSSTAKQQPG